jgi:hypothetical protein
MNRNDYEKAHAWATENMQNVSKVIPENLLAKEERLLTKFIKSNRNPQNNLTALYDFMDKLAAHIHKITPCAKGCSNCCHFNVSISELEADYIAQEAKINLTKDRLPQDFHGQPCPFLKNNACSIYSVRPFVCRRHVFLGNSADWCHPDIANEDEFPQLGFTEIKKSYDFIVQQTNLTKRKDIREFFS